MITIECNLPDINFYIKVDERDYDIVAKKVNESIIPYDKNTSKYIETVSYTHLTLPTILLV